MKRFTNGIMIMLFLCACSLVGYSSTSPPSKTDQYTYTIEKQMPEAGVQTQISANDLETDFKLNCDFYCIAPAPVSVSPVCFTVDKVSHKRLSNGKINKGYLMKDKYGTSKNFMRTRAL